MKTKIIILVVVIIIGCIIGSLLAKGILGIF